jgi:Uma2 family endonuclease
MGHPARSIPPARVVPMPPRVSLAEYLEMEARDPDGPRYEYYNGEVVAMAGASPAHNDIVANLLTALQSRLRGTTCRARAADQRVHIPATSGYVYPDVVVACEPRLYEPATRPAALLNPVLIVEVLSASTEARDRGRKFQSYQTIPSLQHYLLIDADQVAVDLYSRDLNGELWSFRFFSDLAAELLLPALDLVLPLVEVYDAVQFGEGNA